MLVETKKALKDLKALYKDLNKKVSAAEKAFIFQAALFIEREAKLNVAKSVGKNVKIKGLSRTGNLLNSIGHVIKENKSGFSAIIGPRNIKYAQIQEEGGIIKPRKAKALFIPLTRRAQSKGPSKNGGNGLIWGKDFVLAKRAVRRAKPYMAPALNNNIKQLLNILSNSFDKSLK